jgi:4-azaleucine resistance transporter AzlC
MNFLTETQEQRAAPLLSIWSLSIPVAAGYVPLGVVFGFLLVQAGAAWWIPPFTSLLVFAGAAQFMAIPMLAAGDPVGTIILATAVINLRHIFYGFSLLDTLPANWRSRSYLIWVLTDENYSVITSLPTTLSSKQIIGVAMLNHFWWVFGALLGAAAGAQATHSITGIDFSLAALFAVLAVEQWRVSRRATPIVTAVIAYGVASAIAPSQALLLSIGFSFLVGIVISRRTSTKGS